MKAMSRMKKYQYICLIFIGIIVLSTELNALEIKDDDNDAISNESIHTLDDINTSSSGAIHIVKVNDNEFFGSIQQAIRRADNGDTILVKKGSYHENIIIDKSIRLIGENKSTTLIIGEGDGNVIICDADDVTISGFTIMNSGMDYIDSAIQMNANNSMIVDNIIKDCYIGVNLDFSSNTIITNNCIQNNKGTGIAIYDSNQNIISFNILDANDEGIKFSHSFENAIINNKITHHQSDDICIYQSEKITVNGNIIIDSTYGGISLYHSPETMVNNNQVEDTLRGIRIYNSSDSIITENTFFNGRYMGIELSTSANVVISENNISGTCGDGIVVKNASNCALIKNFIEKNRGYGIIFMFESENNTASGNVVSQNFNGLKLDCSPYNIIIDNVFNKTGITFIGTKKIHWSSQTITGNILNGRPIRFYANSEAIHVPIDTSQIICVNCSNFIISDLDISQIDIGIQLLFSSENHVSNNIVNSETYGIMLYQSQENVLSQNSISNTSSAGIFLINSTNNIISLNHIQQSHHGIELEDSMFNSVQYNTLMKSQIGLYLHGAAENKCDKNWVYTNKEIGISLKNSINNSLSNNTVVNNTKGFNLWSSKNNIFFNNSITKINQDHYGFYFQYVTDYENTISPTNHVNENPVQWYTHTDYVTIENIKLFEKRMTNVAQIMIFDCGHITCSDIMIGNNDKGIKLFSSHNISLLDLTITNTSDAIEIHESNDIRISGCRITHTYDDAILLDASSNAFFSENILTNNYGNGINLMQSTNVTIQQNTINENLDQGVGIQQSSHVILHKNILHENQAEGIGIYNTKNAIISENEFKSTGLKIDGNSIEQWESHTFIHNKINNKTIRYYCHQSQINVPSDTAQLILVNCSNSIIQQLNFTSVELGISLAFCSQILVCENSLHRMALYHSSKNTVTENTITNSHGPGLYLSSTSDENRITNNMICNHDGTGIVMDYSSQNTIIGNMIMHNTGSGILLYESLNTIISGNKISQNFKGLTVNKRSNSNQIIENTIERNTVSLMFSESLKNEIRNNNIINNEKMPQQTFWVDYYGGESWKPLQNRNRFHHNYWGRFRLAPKVLSADVWIHVHDHFGGNYLVHWLYFDWNPAKIPFTI